MQSQVTIYTSSTCPYCHRAKTLLESKGVHYNEIDVNANPQEFQSIKDQTGWNTVPQIFINEKFVGGCDDIHLLDGKGELDPLLFQA